MADLNPVTWLWASLPLALGFAAFLLGGVVKGTLGIGLPMVAVPLLSLFIPAVQAMVLMMMPVLLSNLWQAWDSGDARGNLRRFAPMLVCLALTTLLTVPLTLSMSPRALNAAVAGVVLIAVLLLSLQLKLPVSAHNEGWWSAGVGALSGVVGGVSSLTGPLVISYLVALKLPRETFVGAISIIYLFGGVPLYAAFAWHGRVNLTELLLSTLALLPMALGLALGRRIRHRISEAGFRRALLGFLCLVAVVLIVKQP